jgi:hypothetical protein
MREGLFWLNDRQWSRVASLDRGNNPLFALLPASLCRFRHHFDHIIRS